ncbi:nucleotidyltransferase substrate binding protein [Candidatus Babeliales bacterium]|nr:nucleotidyltransferase substrate binding protein [Candidatus Babeliales bacterium]
MKEETKLAYDKLSKALTRLEEAVALPLSSQKIEIDLVIHRFEFTIELFWKVLQKHLFHEYGIDVHGPKPVLQQAYAVGLILDEAMWLAMLQDRNLTSHTYNEKLAFTIYENIKKYTPFLRTSFDTLK